MKKIQINFGLLKIGKGIKTISISEKYSLHKNPQN